MVPRFGRRGFTMIEILVAVGLLAVMTAIIYQAYRITIRAQTETDKLQERYHTARVALMHMTREISMAFLSKHINADEGRSKTLFDGGREKLTFTYLGHQRRVKDVKESDQGVVEYYVRSCKDSARPGKCLFRRGKPIVDADPEKGGTVDVLAEGVKSLKFEYWDREKEDWKSEWEVSSDDFEVAPGQMLDEEITDEEKSMQLPWRVKIRLVLVDDDKDEHTFETQTALMLREPLDFTLGGVVTNLRGALGGRDGGAQPAGAGFGIPGQPGVPGQPVQPAGGHGGGAQPLAAPNPGGGR